jgi:WS/DGAT/MGAT family acyltransferase
MGAQALTKLRSVNERGVLETVKSLLGGDLSTLLPRMPPATRFSGKVSAHRVFTTAELPMADFKQIRRTVPEATINDQFLCVVGGALRKYLDAKKELPDSTLLAMVPVTLRGSDKGGEGNQVGGTVMPVHTEMADPMERLRAICRDARSAKALNDAIGKEVMRDLLQYLPSVIANPVLRNVKLPGLSLIVSNVRGPDVPLYMAGARLMKYEPVSIAVDGMGLNITGFSYDGTLRICAISCREMLPDPGLLFRMPALRLRADEDCGRGGGRVRSPAGPRRRGVAQEGRAQGAGVAIDQEGGAGGRRQSGGCAAQDQAAAAND